jgi:hypothetical protein
MKTPRLVSLALPAILLSGCLEVEQHPKWIDGEYAGKRDNLQSQTNFHGDKVAWAAAIANRNRLQNEYGRTGKGDTEAAGGAPSSGRAAPPMAAPAGGAAGVQEAPATQPSTASPPSAAPAQAAPAGNPSAPAGTAKP